MRPFFRLAALAILFNGASALDSTFLPQDHKPKTDFLPSRDMLQIDNVSGRGTASGGSCHGLVEAALVYREYRATHKEITGKDAPDLAHVTQEMKAANRDPGQVSKRLAEAVQTHVYQQTTQYIQTDNSKRTVFENLKTGLDAGKPVRLSLDDGAGGGHMVAAYDYYKDPDGNLRFRIADPNSPGDDSLTLTYDLKKRGFQSFTSGDTEYDVLGVQRPLERQPEKLLHFIEDARQGRMPKSEFVPSPVGVKLEEEQQASAGIDPLVGGVIIRFPASWYGDAVPEKQFRELVAKIRKFAKSGAAGAIVLTLRERSEELELVSLSRLLAGSASTLGTLTRVRGYVVDEKGEVCVAGLVEPSMPPIPLEWFTVALRAVYRDGTHPFVSLDPDPNDFAAPHKARVGGLPADCTGSDFVRVLLEADYLMKRISLGAEKPAVEGFTSWFEMLRDDPGATAPGIHRDWLSPLPSPVADVFTAQRGPARAVVFESGVQVMTEELKRSQDGLMGTGRTDAVAERSAESFTRCYADLEKRYPAELHALHAIFDLCKLCALWRASGFRHDSLETLAAKPVRTGLAKTAYDGIPARQVGERNLYVSGGAVTRSRTARGRSVEAKELEALLAATAEFPGTQKVVGRVALPAVLEVDPASLKLFNAELHMGAGFECFLSGDYAAAQQRLDLALELDPELTDAYFYRGIARFADGRIEESLADVARAIAAEPRVRGLRAVLQACRGEEAQALSDAATAEAEFADDPDVLSWCALARMFACDFPGSERVTRHILALKPLDRDALASRAWLTRLHRMGPSAAFARIRLERGAPIAISEARAEAYAAIMGFDVAGAAEPLRRAVSLCRRHRDNASVRELHLLEATQLQLVNALVLGANLVEKMGDRDAALAQRATATVVAGELLAAHPDWPSAGFVRSLVPPGPGEEDRRVEVLIHAIDLGRQSDPLIAEFNETMGSPHGRALLLMSTMRELKLRDEESAKKITGEFFRSLGDESLSRLADKAMKAGSDMPHELLEAVEAFADRNPDDPLAILLACSMGTMGVMEAERKGDAEAVLAAAKPLLKRMNRNGLPESAINLVAATQQGVCMMVAEAYEKRLKTEPRLKALSEEAGAGRIDTAAFRKGIAEIRDAACARIDKELSPFAAAFVRASIRAACDREEDALLTTCEQWLAGHEDAALRRDVEAWRTSLPKNKAMPFLTELAAALEFARFETELRTVTLFADIFGLVGANFAQESPELVAQVTAFRAEVDARGKRLKFETPPLDWSGWGGPGAASGPSTSTPRLGRSLWIFVAGGGVLLAIAIAAAVMLRRRRET